MFFVEPQDLNEFGYFSDALVMLFLHCDPSAIRRPVIFSGVISL